MVIPSEEMISRHWNCIYFHLGRYEPKQMVDHWKAIKELESNDKERVS